MYNDFSDDSLLADLPLWSDEQAYAALQAVCSAHNVPIEVIKQLVALQRERQHQERAHGINNAFEEILGRID